MGGCRGRPAESRRQGGRGQDDPIALDISISSSTRGAVRAGMALGPAGEIISAKLSASNLANGGDL